MEIGLRITPFNRMMKITRRELGLTQAELGELVGCSQNQISAIELLRCAVNEETATEIALVLGCHVDDLFPPESRNFRSVKTRSVEFVMEIEDIDSLPSSDFPALLLPSLEQSYVKKELKSIMAQVLSDLPPVERQVIKLRFGLEDGNEHTWGEVGAILGVSRERIRQFERKALARLRHPRRSGVLRGYLTEG